MSRTRTSFIALAVVGLLTLSGCSGSEGEEAEDETPSSAPSGAGVDPEQMQDIRDCLEAAGLEDRLPEGRPSDVPSDLPSGRPSDFGSDLPSGGRGGMMLDDPEVKEALEACGIETPQRAEGSSDS